MYTKTIFKLFLSITVVCSACSIAYADFSMFTERSAWESAAGSQIETEDFNSFAVDTRIVDAPVPLNNMTVFGRTTFMDGDGALIEVAPIDGNDFFNVDGTNFLTTIIRGPVDFLRFDFERPVSAWGVDTVGVSNGGRITNILVFDASDNLLGTINPRTPLDPADPGSQDPFPDHESFYGFSLTGTPAAYLVWENNGFGDAFGIDNIVFVAVPEPTTLPLIIFGCLLVAAKR